jgi:phenylacetate-coenzyme A ligase PaaK-like adenylate-forming protein
VDALNIKVEHINVLSDIPFLPISAFKNYDVSSRKSAVKHVFTSSGTTGSAPSRHLVYDIDLYLDHAEGIFRKQYGDLEDYCFLALLPNYLERGGSSLVAMVEHFINKSRFEESGFYLYDHQKLADQLIACLADGRPTVLFGVSFALLDFLDEFDISFPGLTVIETGGMKGRKKEMTKNQLQLLLSDGFGVDQVHSEYGMTELFSQAYSKKDGLFATPISMKILTREITDPFQNTAFGKTGVMNIVDLANIDSCAFIETQDLGRLYEDGTFEVLGRLDEADIRGCNLMVSDL